MKKKRLAAIIALTLGVAAGAAGCSKEKPVDETPVQTETPTETESTAPTQETTIEPLRLPRKCRRRHLRNRRSAITA